MSTYVVERHPQHCPNGHPWDKPNTFLVGWDSLNADGGRRMWICQTCKGTIYADLGASLTVPAPWYRPAA